MFNGESTDLFKVAVLQGDKPVDVVFLKTEYIKFFEVTDLHDAILKVQRHQIDMLLDLRSVPKYWINEFSANGYMLEKLYIESLTTVKPNLQREIVTGKDIRYVDWVMPGVLAMNMLFSCLWGVGWVVVRYRKNGVLRRLSATPLTPFEFLTAQVVARLIIVTVVTIMVFSGADLLVGLTMRGSYLALFLVFFSGAACFTSMGLLVATRLKTEEVADGLLSLLSWPMMIMSGVWFSMEGAHPVAQAISRIFPLTYLVEAARQIMIDGAGLSDVTFEIALLSGISLLLLLVCAKLFRWS